MGEHASPAFMALVQATAGAAGGIFASAVLMPVEVAKTRIQLSHSGDASTFVTIKNILVEEGPAALFRGSVAKCGESGTKNFVYFYIYDAINTFFKHRIQLTTGMKLFLGCIAGCGATTSCSPLEVLATRMQAESKSNLGVVAFVQQVLEREGVGAFYTGIWYNIMLCINPAIQNVGFDTMKAHILNLKARDGVKAPALSPFQAFLLGAVAKAVATLVTYPLVRLKTILQAGQKLGQKVANEPARPPKLTHRDRSNSVELMRAMSIREDIPAALQSHFRKFCELYRGLGSALMKATLQAALMYMTKDQVEVFVKMLFKVTAKSFYRKSGSLKLGAISGRPLAS